MIGATLPNERIAHVAQAVTEVQVPDVYACIVVAGMQNLERAGISSQENPGYSTCVAHSAPEMQVRPIFEPGRLDALTGIRLVAYPSFNLALCPEVLLTGKRVAVLAVLLNVFRTKPPPSVGSFTSVDRADDMNPALPNRSTVEGVSVPIQAIEVGLAKVPAFVLAPTVGNRADTLRHVEPLIQVWPRPGGVTSTRRVLAFYRCPLTLART